jgi:anti-sigma-K factor RskA
MSDQQDHAMLDDVALYALGVLPAAQAQAVREHMATCKLCQAEYDALAPAAALVGVSAETAGDAKVCPSTLLKPRIMKKVRSEAAAAKASSPAGRSQRAPVWPAYLVAAACFAIALISTIGNIALNDQLHAAQAQLAALTQRSNALARTLAQEHVTLADMLGTDTKRYEVTGGAVITRGSHVYLAMSTMPEPPKGQVYQAWTLAKGAKKVAPSVTFVPDAHGATVISLPIDARTTAAVAVSLEPDGGSKQPTTKPILLVPLT